MRKIEYLFWLSAGIISIVACERNPPSSLAKNKVSVSSLISVDSLHHLLKNSTAFNILDIRPAKEFESGHVPGSINFWRPDFANPDTSFTSLTATKEQLETLFASRGFEPDLPVVVYDGVKNADAANICWILWRYGKKDVTLLNGGFNAWKNAAFEIETGNVVKEKTAFKFKGKEDRSRFATIDSVKRALNDPGVILLDTRSREEFLGETCAPGAKKAGRIPGSICLTFDETEFEKEGGFFLKSHSEIQEILLAKGITKDKKIICYCQSGVRSALMTFVLTEMLGYQNVLNYDGSWAEWSQYDELPYETGP